MNWNCYDTVVEVLADKIAAQAKEIELLKWELEKCKKANNELVAQRVNQKIKEDHDL